mmetsp:Transcript_6450/g.26616  ORF Transcript_6450/g.26616 Transcript_6450/m.26616 type:complete len:201 (+) Transcript_6450:1370-1972(+)
MAAPARCLLALRRSSIARLLQRPALAGESLHFAQDCLNLPPAIGKRPDDCVENTSGKLAGFCRGGGLVLPHRCELGTNSSRSQGLLEELNSVRRLNQGAGESGHSPAVKGLGADSTCKRGRSLLACRAHGPEHALHELGDDNHHSENMVRPDDSHKAGTRSRAPDEREEDPPHLFHGAARNRACPRGRGGGTGGWRLLGV